MNVENPPGAMVTLDMMLPLSGTIDRLGMVDIGQLGPTVRSVFSKLTQISCSYQYNRDRERARATLKFDIEKRDCS